MGTAFDDIGYHVLRGVLTEAELDRLAGPIADNMKRQILNEITDTLWRSPNPNLPFCGSKPPV